MKLSARLTRDIGGVRTVTGKRDMDDSSAGVSSVMASSISTSSNGGSSGISGAGKGSRVSVSSRIGCGSLHGACGG